jgi:hypothetical protein
MNARRSSDPTQWDSPPVPITTSRPGGPAWIAAALEDDLGEELVHGHLAGRQPAVAEPPGDGPDADGERRDVAQRERLGVIGRQDQDGVRPQRRDRVAHGGVGAVDGIALLGRRAVAAGDDQAGVRAGERSNDVHGLGASSTSAPGRRPARQRGSAGRAG